MNKREIATEIFLAGVESVKPFNLINHLVKIDENSLTMVDLKFELAKLKHIYVIGAGKASAMMAQTMESILDNRISEGHIVTKYGHGIPLKFIDITEAGHPIPDENGLKGTEKILKIAQRADSDDLVICLLSGGASALMTDITVDYTLADLKVLNEVLLKCGANIQEMNCIRKHISNIKGGKLAQTIAPATVVSLILSDVIGDPLDVIASGPTAPDPTTFANALEIIKKYNIEDQVPSSIKKYLQDGIAGKYRETLKEDDFQMEHIHNLIIGSNRIALNESVKRAAMLGYDTFVVSNSLEGDASDVAQQILEAAQKKMRLAGEGKVCLLFGGEPTVKVSGNGKGGRNQHLALLLAQLLHGQQFMQDITILCAGTDGTDGPTDAAGAFVDQSTWQDALTRQIDIEGYLANNDSYNFFKMTKCHLITGPTMTNVMDIVVVLCS